MIRNITSALLIITVFVLILWFTRINPGTLPIDLAFGRVEASIPMVLAATFVFGWVFGLACTAAVIIKLVNERRRLRKLLRVSESEVSSLRSLPIVDAD